MLYVSALNIKRIPMKNLMIAVATLLTGTFASAQAWSGTGDQKVQIGLNAYGLGTGITATYDYGVANIVSIGAGANVFFDDDKNDDNNFFIFGRLGIHLQEPLGMPEKWDLYPGINLGVTGDGLEVGGYVGVRYFFNNKVGIYLEAGNNGSIGVSLNL